jgi:hypothetical protein
MITLFSQGDYDFVKRGGPWIFRRHALLIEDFKEGTRPSEAILDSVPVWVRIYDVPWGKQNKRWGLRAGNGLGKALEVDAPATVQDMKEFLRVRVSLPYNRRLQTKLTIGVKGRPGEAAVYKLKYERVPYYCSHCGFMGHRKEVCEKMRQGIPSLDYTAYEIRCSPYKKYEYRSHSVPPPEQLPTRRGLSFASFGSVESRKSFQTPVDQSQNRWTSQQNQYMEREGSREVPEDGDVPPLEEIGLQHDQNLVPVGDGDGFDEEEKPAAEVVEQNLIARVDDMQVDPRPRGTQATNSTRSATSEPIIQFPEEDGQELGVVEAGRV